MDLKARLARLDQLTRKPAAPVDTVSPRVQEAVLGPVLGLSRLPTAAGEVWARDDREPVPVCAAGRLPDVAGILPAGLPADLEPGEILFLDTETTGLAGGTGSLAFPRGARVVGGGVVHGAAAIPERPRPRGAVARGDRRGVVPLPGRGDLQRCQLRPAPAAHARAPRAP